MPSRYPQIAFAVLMFGAAGCSPEASARFDVAGVAPEYTECFDTAFPFVPIFHAYRERAGSVGIFFQSRGGAPQFTDLVHFEVFEPETIATATPYPTVAIVDADTRVGATLDLSESCPAVGVLGMSTNKPQLHESPAIVGTIVFDQFTQEIDGIIAGTVDAQLIDRDGAVIADSFTGDFEFTVQVGQPYEEFRN